MLYELSNQILQLIHTSYPIGHTCIVSEPLQTPLHTVHTFTLGGHKECREGVQVGMGGRGGGVQAGGGVQVGMGMGGGEGGAGGDGGRGGGCRWGWGEGRGVQVGMGGGGAGRWGVGVQVGMGNGGKGEQKRGEGTKEGEMRLPETC